MENCFIDLSDFSDCNVSTKSKFGAQKRIYFSIEYFWGFSIENLPVANVSHNRELFQPHPLPNLSHSRELFFTKRTVSDELQAQQPAMVHGRVPRYTCWTTPTYRHLSYFLYCQVVSVLKKKKRILKKRRSEPISQDVFTSKKWPHSRWWATYGSDCLVGNR